MLAVILSVLKIIGIVLLIILGIIVLLILAVLFVPIRYKGHADFNGDINVHARVTWLIRVLHIKLLYNKPGEQDGEKAEGVFKYTLKIFGITLMGSDKPEKKKKKRKRKRKSAEAIKKRKAAEKVEAGEKAATEAEADIISVAADSKQETKDSNQGAAAEIEDKTVITFDDKKKSGQSSGSGARPKPKTKEKKKKRDILGMVRKLSGLKDRIKEILTGPEYKPTVDKVKKVVKRLLKHLRPSYIRGRVVFGFEDPCTTGKVLGLISIFRPIIPFDVDAYGDFEKKALNGHIEFKGRVRIIVLLICGIKLYRDKNIRKLIKKAKDMKR